MSNSKQNFKSSRFSKIKLKIFISFLIFGFLIGGLSFWIGKKDTTLYINPAGVYISEIVYNQYLIPYWESALKPASYEQIPIRNLTTGKIIGTKNLPQYNFPLKSVENLYIPISLLFWGLVGLVIQLIYNRRKNKVRAKT